MIDNIKLAFCMFQESLAEGSLLELFRQQIFHDRIATPAMMDLTQLKVENIIFDGEYQFIELKADELTSQKWRFTIPSRRAKATRNLNKGLRGFAVVHGFVILGDVWGVAQNGENNVISHPDLEMLGISCEQRDAYIFDMFISPDARGRNLAVSLQRYLQITLKDEGCKKVYGYYWDDNVPAMWMHRMLRFKELSKRRVSRFFFYKSVETIN